MNARRRTLALLVLGAGLCGGCGQRSPPGSPVSLPGWKRTVRFPVGWQVETNSADKVMALGPLGTGEFLTTLLLERRLQPPGERTPFPELPPPRWQTLARGEWPRGEPPGGWADLQHRIGSGLEVRARLAWVVVDGEIYNLTLTAAAADFPRLTNAFWQTWKSLWEPSASAAPVTSGN